MDFEPARRRTLRCLLAVTLLGVTSLAVAQTCGLETSPVLRFAPSVPKANDVITVTVGTLVLQPISQAVVITGNTINVTVTGSIRPPSQPPICVAVAVGPLPPGLYTLNFFQDVPGQSPQVTLNASTTLSVVPTNAAGEPIPAMGSTATLALILALAVSAIAGLRRRYHGPDVS